MKKIICILLACSMMIGLLAGCGNSDAPEKTESSDAEVKITFAGWGQLAEKQIYTTLIDKFMEIHPNIKVDYQHYPGNKESYIVKLISSIAGGKMPDAFYLPTQDFAEWAEAGRLKDLQGYLDASETYKEGTIWETAMSLYRYNTESNTVGEGDVLYGLPKDLSVRALAYNKEIFQEKGVALPDPEIPMTWSEYLSMAKKLTSGSGATKVYGSCNYVTELAVWSNGGNFVSDDNQTITIDTPEFIEALQWKADLDLVHGVAPSQAALSTSGEYERFANGTLATMFIGPWDQATLWDSVDFEWDIMPVPVSDTTKKSVTWLDSAALCVSSSTEEADAAYELIEFICMNEESQRINYESGQAVPNIIEMAETEFLEMEQMPSNKQLFVHYLKTPSACKMKDFYDITNTSWYDEFDTQVTKVWSGEMTAAEFCKDMQPKLQKLLDENN